VTYERSRFPQLVVANTRCGILVEAAKSTMAFKSNNSTTWLAQVGLGGIGLFLGLVVLLHFVEREFSPVRRSVSEYALGEHGYLMNIAFFLLGSGTGALALGPHRGSNPGHGLPSALLGGSAALIIVAGVINADPSTGEVATTTAGLVHRGVVLIAMIGVLVAAFVLAKRFKRDSCWRASARVALTWAVIMLASMVVHLSTVETEVAGLMQRIYVVVVIGWLLFVANLLRVVTWQHVT